MISAKNLRKTGQILAFIIALIPAFYILRMAFAATVFPMELEVREGISWIHVLALKSGVSIYDHLQVAYFASHGPIDHLLKAIVSWVLPFLPSQVIVRIFVFALPFCLVFSTYQSVKPLLFCRWPIAILLMAIIYTGIANLYAYNPLVGRTDPLILCLIAIQAGLTARFLYNKKINWYEQVLYSLIFSLGIFSMWRCLPVVGSFWIIAGWSLYGHHPKQFLKFFLSSGAIFAALFIFNLGFFFNWQMTNFYRHFIGIFLSANYVPLAEGSLFALFPAQLIQSSARWIACLFPLVFLIPFLFLYSALGKGRVCVIGFLVFLNYILHSYGVFKNSAGAGLYYFSPYIEISWIFLVILLMHSKIKNYEKSIVVVLLMYLALVPNWTQILEQSENLESTREPVTKFRETIAQLYREGLVMSEDLHLFKETLGDSLVDNGDGVEDLTRLDYFDSEFHNTGKRFFNLVQTKAYRYYLTGGVQSRVTTEYLKRNYAAIATAPPYNNMSGSGGCVTPINCPILWEKKK